MPEPTAATAFTARFPVLFLGTAMLLMGLYYSLPTAFIENGIVRFFAVIPGGVLLDWLTPGYSVTTTGTRILSPLANLNVLKGCEGTETLLLLYAAMVALGRPLKSTVLGLILGTALVFLVNQIRIVSLFFVAAYQKSYFELVHGFLAPLLMVAIVAVFFLYWNSIRINQTQQQN
jgi:exosortase family protein XrtM